MTQLRKKPLIFLFLMWAAVLLVIGIFDLQVSEGLYKEGSASGGFFEVTGEPPSIILFAFSVNVLFVCHKKPVEKLFDVLWGVGGLTYLADKLATDFIGEGALSFWQCLALAVLTEALCILFFSLYLKRKHPDYFQKGLPDEALNELCENCRKAAIACLITLFVAFFVKVLWGRVRYRDVLAGKGLYSYVAIPHFFSGNMSFPSGHTANAACFLSVGYFVKNKKLRTLLQLALSVWVILVGLSRVRFGAHYLTDVLAGAAVGLCAYFFAPRVLCGLRKVFSDIRLAKSLEK